MTTGRPAPNPSSRRGSAARDQRLRGPASRSCRLQSQGQAEGSEPGAAPKPRAQIASRARSEGQRSAARSSPYHGRGTALACRPHRGASPAGGDFRCRSPREVCERVSGPRGFSGTAGVICSRCGERLGSPARQHVHSPPRLAVLRVIVGRTGTAGPSTGLVGDVRLRILFDTPSAGRVGSVRSPAATAPRGARRRGAWRTRAAIRPSPCEKLSKNRIGNIS